MSHKWSIHRANLCDIASDVLSDIAQPAPRPSRNELALAISNAIVGICKEHFGKGPTKARTYIQGDVITCVLRDGLTQGERTLIESGRTDAFVSHRHLLQDAVRDEFTSAIERLTGRVVIGFFSGTQPDPAMDVEVFVLAEHGED